MIGLAQYLKGFGFKKILFLITLSTWFLEGASLRCIIVAISIVYYCVIFVDSFAKSVVHALQKTNFSRKTF